MSIDVPTNVRVICRLVGIVNYYRDMWRKREHTLAPLKILCLTKVKLKWTDVDNNAFMAMKKVVGRGVLLYYPNFSKIFMIQTDGRKNEAWRSNESK